MKSWWSKKDYIKNCGMPRHNIMHREKRIYILLIESRQVNTCLFLFEPENNEFL